MAQLKYSVVLLVAALGLVAGQDLASLPSCGQICITSMEEAKAVDLGCAANQFSCLCAKPDFHNGINDCAKQNCPADVAPVVSNYAVAFCATATLAPQATPTPATSPAAPETTPPPTPTPSPTSAPVVPSSSAAPTEAQTTPATSPVTPSPAATSSEPSPTPSSSTSTEPTTPTTLVTSPSPTSASSTTTSMSSSSSTMSTKSSSSTSTSSTATSATAVADGKSSSSAAKPSLGAIVGISIGGAAVLLAIIVLALIRRRHKKTQKRKSASLLNQLKISDPMPGSGRSFADSYHSPPSPPRYGYPSEPASELEMSSRRYEDMVPRVAPRLIG